MDERPIPTDEYSVRYCAFVDILGFTGVIADLKHGIINHRQLRDILARVHRPSIPPFKERSGDLRTQSISDAVCISATATKEGLASILRDLENLSFSLLEHGYLIRGGLVRGPLYHDATMAFGEALVEAYRMESQVARYPRIMVSKQVADEAKTYQAEDPDFGDFIRQATDGPFDVHILRLLELFRRGTPDAIGVLEMYADFAKPLQARFDASVDEPRHFEKQQWFARYWNEVVERFDGRVPIITGPGF